MPELGRQNYYFKESDAKILKFSETSVIVERFTSRIICKQASKLFESVYRTAKIDTNCILNQQNQIRSILYLDVYDFFGLRVKNGI